MGNVGLQAGKRLRSGDEAMACEKIGMQGMDAVSQKQAASQAPT